MLALVFIVVKSAPGGVPAHKPGLNLHRPEKGPSASLSAVPDVGQLRSRRGGARKLSVATHHNGVSVLITPAGSLGSEPLDETGVSLMPQREGLSEGTC